MDSEIAVYEHPTFGSIRMFEEDGEIYAVADDFAKMLGHSDATHMLRSLDPGEFHLHTVEGNRGTREAYVITEAGMYHAILIRKAACVKDPEARERVEWFQRWVTHEVLPTIRRKGFYLNVAPDQLGDAAYEELMAYALAANASRIRELEARNAAMRPKAELADAMLGSDDTILVRELAQLLTQAGFPIGQNKLYELLRDDGFLIGANCRDRNQPTRRSIEMGLFEVRETVIEYGGETHVKRTTRVTPKGQAYFLRRYAHVGGDAE